MRGRGVGRGCVVALLLSAALTAQSTKPSPGWRTIAAGDGDGVHFSVNRSHRNVLCFVGDAIFCLVRRESRDVPSGPVGILMSTCDGGLTWQEATQIPVDQFELGAIAAGPEGTELHVVWNARGEDGYHSVYYQAFDAAKREWVGERERLAQGTNGNNQYLAENIAVTSDGTLIAMISAHRSPKAPWTFWCTGLRLKGPKDESWSKPYIASGNWTGVAPGLQLHEDRAYLSYRSNGPNDFGIYRRVFDWRERKWTVEQTRVDEREPDGVHASNTSTTLIDNSGRLYVLYAVGTPRAGSGGLRLAFAKDRDAKELARIEVADDAELEGGNHNYRHYSLARGPGDQVLVFFSKMSEDFTKLYVATYVAGRRVGKVREIGTGKANAFQIVNGVRGDGFVSTLLAVVAGAGDLQGYAMRWPVKFYWR